MARIVLVQETPGIGTEWIAIRIALRILKRIPEGIG